MSTTTERTAALLFVVALFQLVQRPGAANADPIAPIVHVQGFVETSGGTPATGSYKLVFRLYTQKLGGVAQYTQQVNSVQLTGGLFDVELGPLPDGLLETYPEVWVETQLDNEVMARSQLRPVAFALVARTAGEAALASDLACSGCVDEEDLGAPWARAAEPGGAPIDLACDHCVDGSDLAEGGITSFHIQDQAIGAADVGFAYADSTGPKGPAIDVFCQTCIDGKEIVPGVELSGNVTVLGGLTPCKSGQPGCGVTLGSAKIANESGFVTVLSPGGLRVRDEANGAFRPVLFGGGQSAGSFVIDPGNLTVNGKVGVGTGTPSAALHVVGDSLFEGPATFSSTVTYLGDLHLGGNVGIGTNQPAARLDVAGGVKVGTDTGGCTQAKAGTMRWSGTTIEFCSGSSWQAIYDPAKTGGSQGEAAESCLAILQGGYTNGDGFYWLDPNGGQTNDAYRVWCDMTTDGGGWTLLFNLDSGDSARHDWNDTTFWLGTGVENDLASGFTGGIKTQAYSQNDSATQLMVLAHDNGTKKGHATYSIKESYRGKTFHWLMNNVSDAAITTQRLASSGTVGAKLNVWREQTQFGDVFIDHPEAVVLNRQSGWSANENLNRLATTLTNNEYPHTFAGIGGRHVNSGYGSLYESSPIFSYCDGTSLYGGDSNYAPHPSYGTVATAPGCRNGSFAWLPVDFAVFVRETDLSGEKDGSVQALAATSCSEIAALGKDQEGLYWVDPNGGATADAFQVFCDLTSGGGAGYEVTATCKDALDKGLSTGDGVYLIDPVTPSTGANRFFVWCDMTTEGGGWTLLFNLDSGDSVNHHYDDTAFWLTGTPQGNPENGLSKGVKTQAYSAFTKSNELLVVLHDAGAKKGHARYALNAVYRGRTMSWLMSNVQHQAVTGARLSASGTAGAKLNVWRPETQFGDLFVDHPEALVVNRQSGWSAEENRNRLATTLTNNEYPHTFAGIGGRHWNSGYGESYESAPIVSYCDLTSLYGNDGNYGGHPSGGTQPTHPGCRNGSFAYLPIDTAVYVREADVPAGGADGSTQDKAVPSCLDVPSTTSAQYWIDPNGGSTADAVLVFCDQTTDGGGWAVTASCKDALDKGLSYGDGVYMIDPTTPTTGANRYKVFCDMTTAGGGWTLLFNLDSGDGVRHAWDDTTFWQGAATEGSPFSAYAGGHKGQSYASFPIPGEVLVLAHDQGTKKGYAAYDLLGPYHSRTFQWLASNLSDTVITTPRKAASGTVGASLNVWRPQSLYGDLFIDHGEALMVNRQSGWSAGENKNRLATTLSNSQYSHTFAGIGGRHFNSGYGALYEDAPIASYCDMTNLYGTSSNYTGYPGASAYAPASTCLNASFQWLPIDKAVFGR